MVIALQNNLHRRLKHLLQVGFGKEFRYNFKSFAPAATQNSVEMLKRQQVGHFVDLYDQATAEVAASASLEEGDESALQTIVGLWKESPLHSWDLHRNNSLGIGFAYDEDKNLLYATVRLGA